MTFWQVVACLVLRRCRTGFDADADDWVAELRRQRAAADASAAASRQRTGNLFEDEILPHRRREERRR